MTGTEREVDERESRFVHLLQPNRDLASNWAVDVAQALEGYLAELSLTSLFDDSGHSALNFAEAALLIQGSTQVYSRKVEYLYALVFQALELFAQNKQGQADDATAQGGSQDVVEEEEEEEQFLNLDDVPEEPSIDLDVEPSGGASATPAIKRPSSLLVDEGDAKDLSGDTMDLTKFQIATSIMYKGFLLLDPCDADTVDAYLSTDGGNTMAGKATPCPPPTASHLKHHNGILQTPGVTVHETGGGMGPGSTAREHEFCGPEAGDDDDCQEGAGGGGVWEEPYVAEGATGSHHEGLRENNRDGGLGENVTTPHEKHTREEDEDLDPWAPLNPHEPGTLPIKPYQRGQATRKPKVRNQRSAGHTLEFPMASRNGVSFPEFSKALQARERGLRATRRANRSSHTPLPYEELRSAFRTGPSEDMDLNPQNEFEGFGTHDESDGEGMGGFNEDHGGADANFGQADYLSDTLEGKADERSNDNAHHDAFEFEPGMHDAKSFEELCQAHIDQMLQKLAESEVRTELSSRVSKWEQSIGVNLQAEDARPPFDIDVYGGQLLQNLCASSGNGEDCQGQKSFATLVQGQQKSEVCRSLSALLQLVNDGNVTMERGDQPNASECFTKERTFSVKLLNARRRHEDVMNYAAPSQAANATAQLKNPRRGKKNVATERLATPDVGLSDAGEGTPVPARVGISSNLRNSQSKLGTCTPVWTSPSPVKKTTSKRQPPGLSRVGTFDSENRGQTGTGKLNPSKGTPSKITPEGKKRRKRPPLRSIQGQISDR